MRTDRTHACRTGTAGHAAWRSAACRRGSRGLLPGCPGAAPLHDHALLPWRFHPLLRAADGIL